MRLRERFEGLLFAVLAAAKELYGERLVTLAVFGSVGRGTPRPDSDVDILVVARNLPRGRLARVAEFERVEERVANLLEELAGEGITTSLAPVIKTPEEVNRGSLLFLDMVDDARVLYDRDGFFRRFLKRLRARLEELGAERTRYAGTWVWVLKKKYVPGEEFGGLKWW
ncbi:MAG: Nucleotidyltransferase [Clostridia bacterium 62_21]|nr:MAG: Nucleotidyltransferase [Clostridia bacterium 62_21]